MIKTAQNKMTSTNFRFKHLLISDYMKMANQRRYYYISMIWSLIKVFRTTVCRLSQVEIDARVKAINEELKHKNFKDATFITDKTELIHNYGLTTEDYERSVENSKKQEKTLLPLRIKIAPTENSSDSTSILSKKVSFTQESMFNYIILYDSYIMA